MPHLTFIAPPAPPAIQPLIKIDKDLRLQCQSLVQEQAQVIVHCTFKCLYEESHIRIWKTTYLIPVNSTHKSKMIHFENICLNPQTVIVPEGQEHRFTLVFSGLPASCTKFHFKEIIPERGAFIVENILRNSSDVYYIGFS